MSMKTEKPRLFSNWLEVHSMHHLLSNNKLRWSDDGSANVLDSVVKTIQEFDRVISDADAHIIARLASRYSEDELRGTQELGTTLHLFSPIGKKSDGTDNTSGSNDLQHVTLNTGSELYTSVWKLTFTSTTEFSVLSFLEGAQATGAKGSQYNSTNGAVTIEADYWETGTNATGDLYWFSVSRAWKIINTISKTLAASFLLTELTGDQSSEDSSVARVYWNRAKQWLDMLESGKMSLDSSDVETIDVTPQYTPYQIDKYGNSLENSTVAITDQ